MDFSQRVSIKGIALASGLGITKAAHCQALQNNCTKFLPLSDLCDEAKNQVQSWRSVPASWIKSRKFLSQRKYGPASNLALYLAKEVVKDAGWTSEQCREALIYVGSSRGNTAGWVDEWQGRRPIKLMAASNSLHSELAACISIELGIQGAYQVISNGCSSSLDALGMAFTAIKAGMAKRALVIGAELPLSPSMLNAYDKTGMLTKSGLNDPFSPLADGLIPGEGGAAFALESEYTSDSCFAELLGYWANSDAYSPLGLPLDGEPIAALYRQARERFHDFTNEVPVICPHSSGTHANAVAETNALKTAWKGEAKRPLFLPIKPYVGHTMGASGLLEAGILCAYAESGKLPIWMPSLTKPDIDFCFPSQEIPVGDRIFYKSSSAMGGHNALIAIRLKR